MRGRRGLIHEAEIWISWLFRNGVSDLIMAEYFLLIFFLFFFFLLQDSSFMLEEELGLQSPAPHLQDPGPSLRHSSHLAAKAGLSGELGEELDLSFLPDELNTQEDTGVTSLMNVLFFPTNY